MIITCGDGVGKSVREAHIFLSLIISLQDVHLNRLKHGWIHHTLKSYNLLLKA